MPEPMHIKNTGLRGVIVADTRICQIDGRRGILIYRGIRIEELARHSSFPETLYLLLHGRLPKREELHELESQLARARHLPDFVIASLHRWPVRSDSMDVLQASIPLLAMADRHLAEEGRAGQVRDSLTILGGIPAVLAAWHRIRQGLELIPPDERLSHAGNFLWQLNGQRPDPETEKDLDVSFILHAEHSFNASAFACRQVVSTGAHLFAGSSAGIGALSGNLHGGANVKVLEHLFKMEREQWSRQDMARWVKDSLDRGERIMGMGHPVYKTDDPRSGILKDRCEMLARKTGNESRFRFLRDLEELCVKEFASRGKPGIRANVDYYSGLLHFMMGIPTDFMTGVFAAALAAGWCAHMIEEKLAEAQKRPALYRPEAAYIGEDCGLPGCEYIPMDER